MSGLLQLAEQKNPTGQTFVVDEACTLTGIGIFFAKAPADDGYSITLEMRPTTEAGTPSSLRYIPGTRVAATAAQIRAKTDPGGVYAGTTFDAAREFKFSFKQPVSIPQNTLCSFVIYTSAPAGQYQMYVARTLDYLYGSTEAFYTHNSSTEQGAFFSSSNGTTWEPDNTKDVTFKVYKAQFSTSQVSTAVMHCNNPGVKKLTETSFRDGLGLYSYDPLSFTQGSASVKVRHPSHSFQTGDKVTITTDGINSFDSADTVNGVFGRSILGTRDITAADPFGYTFNMDSTADSTIRAGGTGLIATENYGIDQLFLNLPYNTPKKTALSVKADLTTSKSYAGSETAYGTTNDIRIKPNSPIRLKNPHMIATTANETLRLSGNKSSKFTVSLWTDDPNVAPHFNVDTSYLGCENYLVDFQAPTATTNRNTLSSVSYQADSAATGGTSAAAHITVPYMLETSATSIVVLVDAVRPNNAEFSMWYRTKQKSDEETLLEDQKWYEFSKTAKQTKGKNYFELPQTDDYGKFSEYTFSVFNLNAFDQYQIKITMHTTRQTHPPVFRNLRTIATS
tara:strand:+ start:7412 stop:9106 length:1695 start_codon:yes stop_codon:yes gene_type:complete